MMETTPDGRSWQRTWKRPHCWFVPVHCPGGVWEGQVAERSGLHHDWIPLSPLLLLLLLLLLLRQCHCADPGHLPEVAGLKPMKGCGLPVPCCSRLLVDFSLCPDWVKTSPPTPIQLNYQPTQLKKRPEHFTSVTQSF